MIEMVQLEQLLAIEQYGTLSRAAEALYLSQPALSRSMQKLEAELGVKLFDRRKNKIAFNENGKMAVGYAAKILDEVQTMAEQIRHCDKSRRTIFVGSCAPAPLWEITPALGDLYPEMTLSTEIRDIDVLLEGVRNGTYHFAVLPYAVEEDGLRSVRFGEENLFFSLPPEHPLAGSEGLHMRDLNGETMLLRAKIGFWYEIHKQYMPDTQFLVQDESYAFYALVRASALPSFTSDRSMKRDGRVPNRVIVPILDEEVHVTYFCAYLPKNQKLLEKYFRTLEAK